MNQKLLNKSSHFIKKWEGCRLKAYKCSAGIWTIGYGHIKGVLENQVISQKEADDFLNEDLKNTYNNLIKYININMYNVNELTALLSFSFNCGFPFKMVERYKKNDKEAIKRNLPLYNKAGGKILQGLANRRLAELELFNTNAEVGSV